MLPFLNQGAVSKIRDIKEKIDKYYTIVIGCIWTLATLWDIIRFHCYWSDYMLELYSCFFIVFMVLHILFPAKVPKLIIDQFGIITTTFGRGIIMLVFSLLFLGDKHLFHKLASIFLFIGGFIITVLDFLAPSQNDKKYYPSVGNSSQVEDKNQNDSLPPNKMDDSQPEPEVLDKTPSENENKLPSLEEKPKDINNNGFQF